MTKDRLKTIYILSSLALLQIVILLFVNFFSFQNSRLRNLEKKILKGVSVDSIQQIRIEDNKSSFTLQKKDGTWFVTVNEYFLPANMEKISSYLDNLVSLPKGVVVYKGNDNEVLSNYGFEAGSLQKVTITTEKNKDIQLSVGSTGSKRGTSYLKIGDEHSIREVNSFIASETSNQPVQWAVKKIFSDVEYNEVEKVEIYSEMDWFKGSYNLNYVEESADYKDSFKMDPPIVDQPLKDYALRSAVTSLLNLNIDDYKLTGSVAQKTALAKIKLTLNTQKSFNVDIYKADEEDVGDYIIDVDFNDYLYLVDENDVKRFLKAREEFVQAEPETVNQ